MAEAQARDRDSLIEEALAARLKTHAVLVGMAEIVPYPDDLESLGRAQKRAIILIRVYQDRTSPEGLQGARRDKVRELSTVTIELRFLAYNRRGKDSIALAREYAKDALAGFKPEIEHKRYTVVDQIQHVSGGLVGRIKGSKRWDYFDAYELSLIYENRNGGYPANA